MAFYFFMQISLDIRKSIDENATVYFKKAKKLKKKIEGTQEIIAKTKQHLEQAEKKQRILLEKQSQQKKLDIKKEWFDKYRWFMSSEGFLVVAGRDATTNEILMKKHTEEHDVVFHTDMPGSPFVIIKNPQQKLIPEATKQEAADYCASLSNAWKRGLASTEVYSIQPDQVSKEAKSGEYLGKGAFMIYGKRAYYEGKMSLAVCIYENKVMIGPLQAVKALQIPFVQILQGNKKLSDIAKKVQQKIHAEIDDIIRVLPQGVELGR